MNLVVNDILLNELAIIENLPMRLINICEKNELMSLKAILYYYKTSKFKFLKKCGAKSILELTNLCKKYEKYLFLVDGVYEIKIDKTTNNLSFKDNHFPNKLTIRNYNRINVLNKVKQYYKSKGLRFLKKQGIISKIGLTVLILKNQKLKNSKNSINTKSDIFLGELAIKENLPARTVNICKYNNLTSLHKILQFNKSSNFRHLKNCGLKTIDDLTLICIKYNDYNKWTSINLQTEIILDKLNLLNPFQKAIYFKHFEYLLNNLDVNSYDCLSNISNTLNAKDISEVIFADSFNFKNILNCKSLLVIKLEKFKFDLIKLIDFLLPIQNDKLIKEYLKFVIKKIFTDLPDNIDYQIVSFSNENGKIKLFALLKFIIDSGKLLSESDYNLFLYFFTNDNTKFKDLNSIEQFFSLSKERIRQKKLLLEKNIYKYFLFISCFDSDDIINYGIDKSDSCQVIGNLVMQNIKENENVNFNLKFISFIYSVLYSKSYSLLGNNKIIFEKKISEFQLKLKNYYLINSSLYEYFDFERYIQDLYIKINGKIQESYNLHFEGYIYDFLKTKKTFFEEIKMVCEAMLFNEFDIVVDSSGYFIIEQNSKKLTYQYYYDILDEKDQFLTVKEISNIANENFPFLDTNESAVRGILNRESNIFIYKGRASTYGLRKWEDEKENIRGGTLRNIVEEYLSQFETPKHISEILEYTLKYRSGTKKINLMTNIKVEVNNRFAFFNGDFVGLKNKNYPKEATIFNRIVGSSFRKRIFAKMNGWEIEDVIKYFMQNGVYNEIQIRSTIQEKANNGVFKIIKNKLVI